MLSLFVYLVGFRWDFIKAAHWDDMIFLFLIL